jgi:hypothetical protein
MLDDQQADILGQIKHLPRLAALHVLAIGEIAVARPAALRLMLHPVVGNPDALQMRARMTLLATLLAPPTNAADCASRHPREAWRSRLKTVAAPTLAILSRAR